MIRTNYPCRNHLHHPRTMREAFGHHSTQPIEGSKPKRSHKFFAWGLAFFLAFLLGFYANALAVIFNL